MIAIITTILCTLTFFLIGEYIPGLKKLIKLISNLLLKLLSLFGIKIKNKEKTLPVSVEFKGTYKDIKKVKLSKKNLKDISSIDWVFFTVLCVAGILFIINLGVVSGNAISNWANSIITHVCGKEVFQNSTLNTGFTAALFSVMSFSLSKLLQRWKETKQNRLERKQLRLKQKAIALMSTKELVDAAKKKDNSKRKELENTKKEG